MSSPRDMYRQECLTRGVKPNSGLLCLLPNDAPTLKNLTVLHLAHNFIGDRGLSALLPIINCATSLHTLNLRENGLGNDAVRELCRVLRAHPSLRVLELSGNPFTYLAAKHLVHLLEDVEAIAFVGMDDTLMTEPLKAAIARRMQNAMQRKTERRVAERVTVSSHSSVGVTAEDALTLRFLPGVTRRQSDRQTTPPPTAAPKTQTETHEEEEEERRSSFRSQTRPPRPRAKRETESETEREEMEMEKIEKEHEEDIVIIAAAQEIEVRDSLTELKPIHAEEIVPATDTLEAEKEKEKEKLEEEDEEIVVHAEAERIPTFLSDDDEIDLEEDGEAKGEDKPLVTVVPSRGSSNKITPEKSFVRSEGMDKNNSVHCKDKRATVLTDLSCLVSEESSFTQEVRHALAMTATSSNSKDEQKEDIFLDMLFGDD